MDTDEVDPDSIVWKPVSFTYIEYQKGDPLGFVLAWSSLFPIFAVAGFATHIYFRRETHTICFFFGVVMNEMLNMTIKYAVREPRPTSHHTGIGVKYGWPSSHAQFMWFFSIYMTFFLHLRSYALTKADVVWKICATLLLLLLAIVVCYSRVYLLYHTTNQILWGGIIGTVTGSLWFAVTHLLLTPHFSYVVNSRVGEWLMIRDSTLIPNVLWFEYTCSRQESRTRNRKLSSAPKQQ